jgi:hypothetical protein
MKKTDRDSQESAVKCRKFNNFNGTFFSLFPVYTLLSRDQMMYPTQNKIINCKFTVFFIIFLTLFFLFCGYLWIFVLSF